MNRIEARMNQLQERNEKALITYMTAGLPDMEGMKSIIRANEKAGCDVIELGIPFSDPVADGPVIQAASYKAICQGVNLTSVLKEVEILRSEGMELPIVFMMYYNTILHYGVEKFVESCMKAGVDGVIIPDLPFEEQGELKAALTKKEQQGGDVPILIQFVSPVSRERIPMILEEAKGFVYCVSSTGTTGQAEDFHKEIRNYLTGVKEVSPIPVMMEFGTGTADDVLPVRDSIDGAIVGSHFVSLMEEKAYSPAVAEEYVSTFKKTLNG